MNGVLWVVYEGEVSRCSKHVRRMTSNRQLRISEVGQQLQGVDNAYLGSGRASASAGTA